MSDREWKPLIDHAPQVGDVFEGKHGVSELICTEDGYAHAPCWGTDEIAPFSYFQDLYRVIHRAKKRGTEKTGTGLSSEDNK